MRKHNLPVFTAGIPSLLLIFLILCLSVFSVLSLSSAVADKKLSRKSADHTLEYYEASNKANDSLATIDEILVESRETAHNPKDYYEQVENKITSMSDFVFSNTGDTATISWDTSINDSQVLSVQISLPYPEQEGNSFYNIEQWQVINKDNWTPDQSQHVYRGNEKGEK